MLITPRQHQAMILPVPVPARRGLGGHGGGPVGDRGRRRRRQPRRPDAPVVPGARGRAGGADGRRSGGGDARRHRHRWPSAVRRRRRRWRASLWIQTVVDQFAGYGNLGHVLFGSGDAGRAGFVRGARIVAATLVSPYTFVRPGYRDFDDDRAVRLGVAVDRVLAGARIRDRMGCGRRSSGAGCAPAAGTLVAIVAVLAGVLDAALLPRTTFGYTIMNYRWLWATGAFVADAACSSHIGRWAKRTIATGGRGTAFFARPRARRAGGRQPAAFRCRTCVADQYLAEQRSIEDALDQVDGVLDEIADRRTGRRRRLGDVLRARLHVSVAGRDAGTRRRLPVRRRLPGAPLRHRVE